jgi:hypothetical protein
MLIVIGALVGVFLLVAVAVVVVREVNATTEVEAAPGYSLPEAVTFVRERTGLPGTVVEPLTRYCLGLLEKAGVALSAQRPSGDELDGEEMVLDVDGLARAMAEGTAVPAGDDDRWAVAEAFLEYLAAIGAVGDEADG